jgi:AraC-like DNA-binding protein
MSHPDTKLTIPLTDWGSLTCALIWIYDSSVPSSANQRNIVPTRESVAWFIREGEATVRTENQEWHLRPGEWFFLPETNYWQDFSQDFKMLSIRFKAAWVTGIPIFHHRDGIRLDGAHYPQLEKKATPLCRAYERHFPNLGRNLRAASAPPGLYFKLQHSLMSWLHAYAETLLAEGRVPTRLSSSDPRMLTVARYLENWPLREALDEEELALQMNLSTRQLSRLFLNDFGSTPIRYFNDRKLLSAKSALEGRENTVKEIAFEHGFKSLSHFSTWFRKQCGQSPRDYRKAHERHSHG